MRPLRLAVVVACLLGIPAGVGAFTFVYAKGYSYLSTDPRTCLNCHIMSQQYDAWLKSGHRHIATCVECHLPHGGIAKWVAKVDQGFRHSVAFTLQNFDEPITIVPRDPRSCGSTACAATKRSFTRWPAARPARSSTACTAMPPRGMERGTDMGSNRSSGSARLWLLMMLAFAGIGGLTVLLLALLTNIFERKQEGRQPFVRVVEVTEATLDPKVWGQNWPHEYDSYLKTSLPTTTKYGGRGLGRAMPVRPSRSSSGNPGSSASSRAMPSRSTTGTAAGTTTRSSTRSRPGG